MSLTRERVGGARSARRDPERDTLDRAIRVVGLLLRHPGPRRRTQSLGDLGRGTRADRIRALDEFFRGEPDVKSAGLRPVFKQLQRWAEVRDAACPRAMATMLWALARDPRASVRSQRGRFLDEVERVVFSAYAPSLDSDSVHRSGNARWMSSAVGVGRGERTSELLAHHVSSASNRSRTG